MNPRPLGRSADYNVAIDRLDLDPQILEEVDCLNDLFGRSAEFDAHQAHAVLHGSGAHVEFERVGCGSGQAAHDGLTRGGSRKAQPELLLVVGHG